jgi:hypothetical protein
MKAIRHMPVSAGSAAIPHQLEQPFDICEPHLWIARPAMLVQCSDLVRRDLVSLDRIVFSMEGSQVRHKPAADLWRQL